LDSRDAAGDSPLTWASWALRETAILRLLCFEPHRIHPDRRTTQVHLLGTPLGRWGA
jgi:palmitoyltransferase